jgi:acetyl esterase/lipase|tara:strand:- start:1447 stop:2292 length:846 start_codon:yes stop_codon:yes gene_type:complete
MKNILAIVASLFVAGQTLAQGNKTIYLWPGQVPGETEAKHDPVQTDNTSGNVIRITDITNPALIVYEPEESKKNGSSVIVCPGGGYSILAVDKEGYEIAEWLNSLGYTAFVLQYRVPKKYEGAFMDIQRAIRIVRNGANKWKLDVDTVGVIGFSAGASLSAHLSTRFTEQTYLKIDAMDDLSSQPNFTMLIYPAGLDRGENRSLTPELTISDKTPPTFIFATTDDRHANSALVYAGALRDAKIAVEVHLLPEGGHGYGMRKGNAAGETWPKLAEVWLNNLK